ncbi:MAG TPA: hypothetical protein PK228_14665 [Saprospiraceae bacterium]|nr:hypothetical protein [Saprospiraceae bacterium]
MKIEFIFSLLLLGLGCTSPSQPQLTQPTVEQPQVTSTSPCDGDFIHFLEDTLFTSPKSEFEFLSEAGTFFIKKLKLPKGYFGITANPGFFIATYQTDSVGNWQRTFCGDFDGGVNYKFITSDANFDGHNDLLVDVASGGTFGHFTVGFLYDPQRQIFRRDTALDLSNLTIDVKNKQLRSRHYSSIYGGNCKWLYAWEGDSLVLLEEAVYHAEVDSATISIQKRQKDGRMIHSSLEGKIEPLWEVFVQKCVWRGDWDID